MNSKEIEELRKEVYEMSNSMLPLDMFFNDIRDNKSPTFNKELAYKDLREIVERFKELKKVNVVLHTRIHKLEEQNKKMEKLLNIVLPEKVEKYEKIKNGEWYHFERDIIIEKDTKDLIEEIIKILEEK